MITSKSKVKQSVALKALLVKDIYYVKDGSQQRVPKGCEIYVDPKKNIALINGDHVEVTPDEYDTFIH